MPNKNYIEGRRKEYKIVHEERSKDRIAFRSAGSHSCIDVVSIDTNTKIIYLIQSKPNTASYKYKHKLELEHADLNGIYCVVFSVI